MWTEYFDYDTPCNSEEDVERHVDHFKLLSSSYTGPFRYSSTLQAQWYNSGTLIKFRYSGTRYSRAFQVQGYPLGTVGPFRYSRTLQ